jgi:hypothetical protein
MNIFVLDEDFDTCAEYHIDKHIVKMPLEAAQLLCSAHWISQVGFIPRKITPTERAEAQKLVTSDFYGMTHYNHPCAIWARSSLDNFEWLHCYANALNSEYGYRYGGKSHKSLGVVNRLPIPNIPRLGLTPFALAMPDELKSDNAIESYRMFYMLDKSPFASWKYRSPPPWWDSSITDGVETRISRR